MTPPQVSLGRGGFFPARRRSRPRQINKAYEANGIDKANGINTLFPISFADIIRNTNQGFPLSFHNTLNLMGWSVSMEKEKEAFASLLRWEAAFAGLGKRACARLFCLPRGAKGRGSSFLSGKIAASPGHRERY